jgi:FtsP/CotA-like multicopper oxidase with cupredoxin domain
MYLLKHRWSRLTRNAWRNRQELIAAGMISRRDLLKLGLLSGAGYLLAKHGLSTRAHAHDMVSPPTRAFVDPLPIMPVKQPVPNGAAGLYPYPTVQPNNAGGEGRTRAHQLYTTYASRFAWPPPKVFEVRQREALAYVSPDLPQQRLWGFDGVVPGPTYHARYGEPILVRNRNELPADNGGFGIQQVSTHMHNGHTPSESDGFPGDYFPNPENPAIANAAFYDHNYPNVLAGFSVAPTAPNGDINESLSTLWYHDHRVAFTAQNVYKGLAGFYLLFNQYDTGEETTGFHLPGVRDPNDFYAPVKYDIPLMLGDRLFDAESGALFFDLFNTDGILGDKFLVNGKIQPYLEVEPRRYRFRVLDGGPSRFYQLFLTDQAANTAIPFWHLANDGNLLPKPIKVTSVAIAVAEREDIVIDFSQWAGQTLYLENRLNQSDGKGPDANVGAPLSLAPPGQGQFILQFRVGTAAVDDASVDFETNPNVQHYTLPARPLPRLTRTFNFERELQTWMVNGKAFPDAADVVHFRVKKNSAEQWNIRNSSGGWMHPIHIHFEEFRMLTRNGMTIGPGNVEYSRKDVLRLQHGELNSVFFRFRDFEGRYPIHCHNTIHEDHAMMMRWDIDATGDVNREP